MSVSMSALTQVLLYFTVVLLLVKPLGWYMAQVYQGKHTPLSRMLQPCERLIYRLCAIDPDEGMGWKHYVFVMMLLNGFGIVFVYVVQRCQGALPLNPQHFDSPSLWVAFNTAVSFVTNTNWQAYVGETTMSYLTQMLALTSQNFLSAATGMSLLVAFIRGLSVQRGDHLGNYWVDMVRSILYILLPLSFILALILVSQGVIQTLGPNQTVNTLSQGVQQTIPMGPVASQVAIKQLGSNGGGFFAANGAHPFENPTAITNFFEMLAILLIPAALTYTFGFMIADLRQGRALLLVMAILFLPSVYMTIAVEQQSNSALTVLGVVGPNMEGKESRFGVVNSVLWTVATTATSNGSVNSMLDSYSPIGGLIPLWLMHLGEVVFGGVGCGVYGMLLMVIIAVFIGGLMVGRTPEYLGKKIEPFEMKMAAIAVLLMPLLVLLFTAFAVVAPMGLRAIANPGPHGLTEVLYAVTSMMNNNGSAFGGLNATEPFYLIGGSFLMLLGRYGVAIPMLALSGSLLQKKISPAGLGTLTTHTPLFGILLIAVVGILGALSFLPVLVLGPIVEYLLSWMPYVS